MVSDIDQFGRDTSNNNNSNLNVEKSKKILESLAEIKSQLENKDYNPNFNDSSPKTKVSNSRDNSDFDELKLKIDSLEKKLNSIDMLLNSESINEKIYEPMSQKFDESVSVFHQLDNQSSTQNNNSLLVLENENDLYKSNFNLFRFIMTVNFLFFILIGLVVYIKNIPLKNILKIFLDFN